MGGASAGDDPAHDTYVTFTFTYDKGGKSEVVKTARSTACTPTSKPRICMMWRELWQALAQRT